MSQSQTGSLALITATLAGGLSLLLIPSGLLWITSLIGLILLLILLAYDGDERRSALQTIAFSAVCGFCLTLVSLAVYQFLLKGSVPEFPQLARTWLPITYLGATILMLLIDFTRMGARSAPSYQLPAAHTSITAMPLNVRPAQQPLPPNVPPPAPVPVAEPASEIVHPEPIEPRLVRNSEPAHPIPAAVPLQPGKETNIYVNLLGEGMNMMRAVRAEHLGRDYYRIIEPMPDTEQWEYSPGQVVVCRKKNLSSGKALVAVEEAPRAQ